MISFIDQLYWREPWWLMLTLFPFLLIGWKLWHQQRGLKQYADTHLLPWVVVSEKVENNYWKYLLQILVWLFFSMAAAGPRHLVSAPNEILPPLGAAVIVVDHSRSMQATDMFPNRLQLANKMVEQWSQQKNKVKLGLVIFSGASHVVLPATSDKHAFYEMAKLLNEIQLPTYGSAFSQALLQAKILLMNEAGERAIILLSDGDLPEEEWLNVNNIVSELNKLHITLHLLGVGSLSPTALNDSPGHWLKYKGNAVLTRLNESKFKRLAAMNKNVHYARLNPEKHHQLSNVWHLPNTRISKDNQSRAVWKEYFSWPLLTAILLMLVKQLSFSRRFTQNLFHGIAFFAISSLFMTQPKLAYAQNSNESETLQQAYLLWGNENYTDAAKTYATIEGYDARMGEGASCFRDEKIDCAINAFSRAAWLANSKSQRGKAAFNLGNSFFKQGDFKSAINLYKDALRYQPEHVDYKNNLTFSIEVQKNIERHNRLLANRNKLKKEGVGDVETIINLNNEHVSTLDMGFSKKTARKLIANNNAVILSEEQLAMYMQRSQNYARLLTGSSRSEFLTTQMAKQHDWSRFSNEKPELENGNHFWNRLFELEENIPTHRDKPEIILGVQPW